MTYPEKPSALAAEHLSHFIERVRDPDTHFVISLSADGWVELSVYDLSGRRVATLVNAEQTAGRHEIAWNCGEVPSGVYLYRLETGSGTLTQRLVVSR